MEQEPIIKDNPTNDSNQGSPSLKGFDLQQGDPSLFQASTNKQKESRTERRFNGLMTEGSNEAGGLEVPIHSGEDHHKNTLLNSRP